MSTKKYLDKDGLSYFWGKVKNKIPTEEVAISTTQPTGNEKLWINPNESVNVYGSYISNTYGSSQVIGYSQEYINKIGTSSTVLLNWTSSSADIVQLSGDISDYRDLFFLLSTSADDTSGNAYTHIIPVGAAKTIFMNPNNQSSCKAINLYSVLPESGMNTRCYFTSNTSIRLWNNSGVTSYVKIIGYK